MSENQIIKEDLMLKLFNLPHRDLTSEEISFIASHIPDNPSGSGTYSDSLNSFNDDDFDFEAEGPVGVMKLSSDKTVKLMTELQEKMLKSDVDHTNVKDLYIYGVREVFLGKHSKDLIKSLIGERLMVAAKETVNLSHNMSNDKNPSDAIERLRKALEELKRRGGLPPEED